MLAAKSDFLKRLLVDIPEGSDAVIILPDFSLNDVEILFEKLMNDESKIQSNLWEMLVEPKELKPNDFQDMNNAGVEKREVAAEIDINSDKHFKNTFPTETTFEESDNFEQIEPKTVTNRVIADFYEAVQVHDETIENDDGKDITQSVDKKNEVKKKQKIYQEAVEDFTR